VKHDAPVADIVVVAKDWRTLGGHDPPHDRTTSQL
jgi:hypothetical protein